MQKSDFDYPLPPERIAQTPAEPRGASRLLHLEGATGDGVGGEIRDLQFADLPALLRDGDLLILNDTRVIPARLFGVKDSGGRVEVLMERLLGGRQALAQVRASKPPKVQSRLALDGGVGVRVCARRGEFFELEFETDEPLPALLERIGHVPLPPYITHPDGPIDRARYQTLFARAPGAVAAPTAGLHFDDAMLDRLRALGMEMDYVTLHVGAGTFQPLRTEKIEGQRLHPETLRVGGDVCARVNAARASGRRVVAVGTTVVRALETAVRDGTLQPFDGETDIFIYPGYRFQIVDALLTNFHLPRSSLLMLVCAFGGTENVLAAYRHAVERRYRFFSYGDAMFVTPATQDR